MTEDRSVESLLEAAERTMSAAGCASLITVDEFGDPSARAVAAFPPDRDFARIVVGTHPDSRKTAHVRSDPRVVLSYIDMGERGYVTVIGKAHLSGAAEDKRAYWTDRFAAFWPDGPDSEDYLLMFVVPERVELRSFGLNVAGEPTRWSPVILERGGSGEWRQTN